MSTCPSLVLILLFALIVQSYAAPPKDPQFESFGNLLKSSPFFVETTAKIPEPKKKLTMKLELKGMVKLPDGWIVSIADVSKPKEIITLRKSTNGTTLGNENQGLKLKSVSQDKLNYKNSTVELLSGNELLTVGYSESSLKQAVSKQNTKNPKPAPGEKEPNDANSVTEQEEMEPKIGPVRRRRVIMPSRPGIGEPNEPIQ